MKLLLQCQGFLIPSVEFCCHNAGDSDLQPMPSYTKDDFAELDSQDVWYRRSKGVTPAKGWLKWLKEQDRLELILDGGDIDPIKISNRSLASIGHSHSHKIQLINPNP